MMKKSTILLLLLSLSVFARQLDEPTKKAVESIRADDIKSHMYFLSADEMAGRDAGSHEGRITANYIASQFMRYGLKPVGDGGTYFQNFDLIEAWVDNDNTELKAKIDGVEKTYQLGFDFNLARQSNNPAQVTAPVIFLGYGVNAPEYGYNEFAGVNLRGKIAMVLSSEPQSSDANSKFKGKWETIHGKIWHKIETLRKAGAAGIVVINPSRPTRPPRLASAPTDFQAGVTPRIQLAGSLWDIPTFSISQSVANEWLASAGKTVDVLQQSIDRNLKPQPIEITGLTITLKKALKSRRVIRTRNVVGLLEGSDPQLKDEAVIITAHYDHVGTVAGRIYRGADDNASGTIGVMEIAEAYLTAKLKPKRSILFVVFEAEERGLLGAFYYVDRPIIPLAKTYVNLNMDMIGRDEHSPTWNTTPEQNRNGVNVVGTLYNPELRKMIEASNQGIGLSLDFKTDTVDSESWFSRSDHFPFATKSIPMVLFNTGEHPDYHTENDTWDKINYPKMEKIVRLIFLTSLEAANATHKIDFKP
ncbi:MAG: M28 family peptidase [Acidobacteriota bacterium]